MISNFVFSAKIAWELDDDDYEEWEELLRFSMEKGLDVGSDAVSVLDYVAEAISQSPISASSMRIADSLLTHLEMSEARQVPDAIFAFVNDTLLSTYSLESRNNTTSMWTVRSLTRALDGCPSGLRSNLVQVIEDGLSVWLTDEDETLSQEEYIFNVSVNLLYCLTKLNACSRFFRCTNPYFLHFGHLSSPSEHSRSCLPCFQHP